MIEFKQKQIFIDGQPKLIMAGEIHYYRLDVEDWEDRILKLKEAGCNAVATYIPWICHEEEEGVVDVTGHTNPRLNIGKFIELCQQHDLYFIVRPGPFVMAEMKNDGIPFWVQEKYPEVIATTWDGNPVTTVTHDYLSPNFLKESKRWYKEIIHVLKPFLHENGGNIIAFQLDNEVGMLSWVSNCPDFSDVVLADFKQWLKEKYDNELTTRYETVDFNDDKAFRKAVESPTEEYALVLRQDIGMYMRYRFKKYIAILREYAEEFGVNDVLWFVNIHGTSAGRGGTFPIGISQLYETYEDGRFVSGSDIYLGDLTMNNFQDLYIINAFMDAVHNEHQPLTSLEFEAGDGNYGETCFRYDVSAADLKTRMCMAQGFKLLNYYLFTGGYNYRLHSPRHDGNDRIATTGERHGFAAPISPEGEYNYTYDRMAESIQRMLAVGDKLATMTEETDGLALAFIPDYFMTEYHYPHSEKMKQVMNSLQAQRANGTWDTMVKAVLLNGYRFKSIDIQNKAITDVKTMMVTSALYMHRHVQQKLVDFIQAGGNVLLYGELPLYDMEGNECSILKDALHVQAAKHVYGDWNMYLSVYGDGIAKAQPEIRTYYAQTFEVTNVEPLLRVYGTDALCGFEKKVGSGKIAVIATAYRCDLPFFKQLLEGLGVSPALTHDYRSHGLFTTVSKNVKGEKFVHILNLEGYEKKLALHYQGAPLFDGKQVTIESKRGLMLPLNMVVTDDVKIVYATAEIQKIEENKLTFALTQQQDVIVLETTRSVVESPAYTVEQKEGRIYITITNKQQSVEIHFN